MEVSGEAIPFIDIIPLEGDGEKGPVRFEINNNAASLLVRMRKKNISVLAISGPQRTGKSFLANRFLNRMKGFAVGPTTQPCTKGLWIWSEPVPIDEKTDMIILDCEGLHSTQRDHTIDMKIFTLAILLSSVFVYNQLGHIDEMSVENMSLVINLAKNISVKGKSSDEKSLSEFSPAFFWVLRDFSLNLKGKSDKYKNYQLVNT